MKWICKQVINDYLFVVAVLFVSISSYGQEIQYPDHVDIRDITRSHFDSVGVDEYYKQDRLLVQKQFNCDLLAEKKAPLLQINLCKFNNQFTFFDYRMPKPDNLNLFSFNTDIKKKFSKENSLLLFYNLDPEISFVKDLFLSNRYNTILSIQFNPLNNSFVNCMARNQQASKVCSLTALILHGKKLYLKHFLVHIQNTGFVIIDNKVNPHTEYISEDVDISFELGLVDRVMSISIDSVFGVFKKNYPVSVPGFDFTGKKIRGLTPGKQYFISANDNLNPGAKSYRRRGDHEYFFDLPFIKILEEDDQGELVYADGTGLHTTPYARPLKRGFVSAGCFRGRPLDLIEWFFIFYSRTKKRADFNISEYLVGAYHPSPQLNTNYKKQAYQKKREGRESKPTEMVWMNLSPPLQFYK